MTKLLKNLLVGAVLLAAAHVSQPAHAFELVSPALHASSLFHSYSCRVCAFGGSASRELVICKDGSC